MIEVITLSEGVTLRHVQDRRFKQGCLSVQFVRPMENEEAALNALLRHRQRCQPEQHRRPTQAEARHAHAGNKATFHSPLAQRAHEAEADKRPQGNQMCPALGNMIYHGSTRCLFYCLCRINVPF